jgi:hypothetical protein
MDQVETLVLLQWFKDDASLESLEKLLALFPNVKSLRVSAHVSRGDVGMELGRLVLRNLSHISELVVEPDHDTASSDISAYVESILSGLGSVWTLTRMSNHRVHFTAEGRGRGEFSTFFIKD